MRRSYKLRKKKPSIIHNDVEKKFIKIDDRTMIEVPANIPDDVAKERYLRKMTASQSKPLPPRAKTQVLYSEKPIGSLEDIQNSIVDDSDLPDDE